MDDGTIEERKDSWGGVKNFFNYEDYPEKIMSIINPTVWNKVIDREFLNKWNLRFEPLSSSNDITFSALCSACASRIAYLYESLYTYRINVTNSITTKIKNGGYIQSKLQNVISAVCNVYYKARKLPHYKIIKPSVQTFIAGNLKWALDNYTKDGSRAREWFYEEIGKIFFGLPVFYDVRAELIGKPLYYFIQIAKESAEENFDMSYFPKVIVSLTSYPKRIGTVHKAVETLLKQTILPDKIILWLADSEFPEKEKELPSELLSLQSNIFEIRWTKDIKSYKKLIPALEFFSDEIIITFDDDIFYENNRVELLLRAYRLKPDCIHTHRVTLIEYKSPEDITITPASQKFYLLPSYLHKLGSGAGCLFPPNCFYKDITREDLFMKLAPTNDDIWFWMMGILNGYKVNLVENHIDYLDYIPGTQDEALWKINNKGENFFFKHFKNILCYYPVIQDILKHEQAGFEIDKLKNEFENRVAWYEGEIAAIHSSVSYKLGRFFTWIPRKIRGLIRCYKENGIAYTIRRTAEHLI